MKSVDKVFLPPRAETFLMDGKTTHLVSVMSLEVLFLDYYLISAPFMTTTTTTTPNTTTIGMVFISCINTIITVHCNSI